MDSLDRVGKFKQYNILLMMIWQKVYRLNSTKYASIGKKRNYAQRKDGFDLNLAKSKCYAGQRKCRWNHSRNFHFRKCNKMKDIDVINNGADTFLKSHWIPRFPDFLKYFLQALKSEQYIHCDLFMSTPTLSDPPTNW